MTIYSNRYEDMPSAEILRRVRELDLVSSTFLRSVPPSYDPITFTSLFASIGFSTAGIAGTSISVASIAGTIASTALTIGIQALMAPKPPKPEDGHSPIAQSLPFRIWGVGRTRIAGAKMLWEAKSNLLFMVCALAAHPSHAINRYYLNSDEVFIADKTSTEVLNGPRGRVTPKNSRYKSGGVWIYTRLGASPETPYAALVSELSSSGAWTNKHRGDGQTSLALIANNPKADKQQSDYPYGPPVPSVEGDWALCWDFRDSSQSPTDRSTWTWTRNSALICAWHLCFNEFGFRLNYLKALMPVINLWKEEADVCDEQIPAANGGTWTRYQCSGWDTTENGPKAGMNSILASCDGHLVNRGDGARILTVGKFRESRCGTIDERDIIGHQVQYDVLFEEEINRLIPKFAYPDTGYTTADTDYFEDTAAQLEAGRVLSQDGNYQWVTEWRQTRFLGKRDFLRARQKVKGSLDIRLAGINSVYKRWNRVVSPTRLPKLDGKVVENRQTIISIMKAAFSMDFIQHPDNIDAWSPATDEGKQPPVPPVVDSDTIAIPVINTVQPKSTGSSVYLRVLLVDPVDASLTPIIQYRITDVGSGVPGEWVRQTFADASASGGYIELNTAVVPSNATLDVQAIYKASNNDEGDPSTTNTINSRVDTIAPDAPVNPSYDLTSGQFSVEAANSTATQGRTASITFKMGTTAETYEAASTIESLAASPGDSRFVTVVLPAGTTRLWAASANTSGIVCSIPVHLDVTV